MPTNFKVTPDPVLAAAEQDIDELLKVAKDAIEDKKGERPVALDLDKVVDYLDYIIICSGETDHQNRAIAENVVESLGRYGFEPENVSGYENGQWILVDYGALVVHIFLSKLRDYYRLEELWAEGREIQL
jgi:ribosome-associated protein